MKHMPINNLPASVPVFRVPATVLVQSQDFLRERGSKQLEGTALWAGEPEEDGGVRITRLIVPAQVAESTEFGSYVELTPRAHYTLPDLLAEGELFYARIHSHPGRAYHSSTDDANRVITQNGAISIVVPDFARATLDLARCAIYYLEHGRGWLPLTPVQVNQHFRVEGPRHAR
jgi:hypothetical protein